MSVRMRMGVDCVLRSRRLMGVFVCPPPQSNGRGIAQARSHAPVHARRRATTSFTVGSPAESAPHFAQRKTGARLVD